MSIEIYCNLCFELKSEIRRTFFLTSCSHVFCEACQFNSKNFCKLCKAQCKTLKINKDMPAETKMYFNRNSVELLLKNIEKIRDFQEKQVKFYCEKTRPYWEKVQAAHHHVNKLHGVRKKYAEVIRKEKQIQTLLKEAYQSKRITPDLFDLCSYRSSSDVSQRSKSSSQNRNTSLNVTPRNSPNYLSPTFLAGSSHKSSPTPTMQSLGTPSISGAQSNASSSASLTNRVQASKSKFSPTDHSKTVSTNSHLIPGLLKLSAKTPSPGTSYFAASSPAPARPSIYKETQNSMLAKTLRSMARASQMKFEASRKKPKF